ncbi:MAG TPA: hypothetical protein VK178_11420 [Opitutaceae bacterium]|nr:hypothetical protein [Opitutaceae bacterium]
MRTKRDGFAVVLVAALLAAIVLLLVALAGLARSELRSVRQRTAAEQARRNAIVGMRVAIGRLQAAAGPDARSTATAQHVGARNSRWTGVWSDAGAPLWLVSGAPADADVEVTTSGPGADGALLVGANTCSLADGAVAAFFEEIAEADSPGAASVGRYAFWIGDEGVKGNVGVVDRIDSVPLPPWAEIDDPVATAAERARLRQLIAHRAGNDAVEGFALAAETDATARARWAQFGAALTPAQLRFQELGTAQETENYRAFLRRRFHDFTVCSAGVLANAASGGLRRNFSDLQASAVPAAVRDLERFRPVNGRLPISAGTAPAGEPSAQVKPIVTEWALDFVPYHEDGGNRLLLGCRLRVELWNPFNLPLAQNASGVPDFWVRVGETPASGLPAVRVRGPAGEVGTFDLGGVLGATRAVPLDLPGDVAAGRVTRIETVLADAWDTGLTVDDPTPEDASDDLLRFEAADDAALAITIVLTTGEGAPLTTLSGSPSRGFARSTSGGWTVVGNAPFAAGDGGVERLGVSYHFRLDPARGSWGDWIAPSAPLLAAADLKAVRLGWESELWRSVGADPAACAAAVRAQFASDELFSSGTALAPFDFTVQRNLSIAALGQLSAELERALGIGNPWGGARNTVFDEAFFNPVPRSWRAGETLPNVRHRVVPDSAGREPTAAELGGEGAARFLLVDGAFNVNSTSAEAWTIAFGRAVLGWTDASGAAADFENPFFGLGQSAPFAQSGARGVRQFPDEAIRALAREIVQRIGVRPRPFRSLGEFVNSGVLQDAIDAAGLNTRLEFCADLGGVAPERFSVNYLTQAAVLNTLAPLLAVRSDTFTIRVAAEALNPALPTDDPDHVAARAWCEAVLQRLPEYVDPAEDAMVRPPNAADNATLGRRFRIAQFRWLGPDDI